MPAAVASTLLASLKSVKYNINILHGLFVFRHMYEKREIY